MRFRSTVLMKTASPHAPLFRCSPAALPTALPALLFLQLLLALLGCATSLALKVVIVPLARGMALELSVAETLLTTGMHGAAPPQKPDTPFPSAAAGVLVCIYFIARAGVVCRPAGVRHAARDGGGDGRRDAGGARASDSCRSALPTPLCCPCGSAPLDPLGGTNTNTG